MASTAATPVPTEADLLKMARWLRTTSSVGETVLMPLAGKNPMMPHRKADASGASPWGWTEYDAFRTSSPLHASWGLLLDRLCVVDADSEETWRRLESEGSVEVRAALSSCPVQETRKGRHYLFLRPTWADEEGFYDGPIPKSTGLQGDFKSVCRTGTRGVLAIAPSIDKKWMPGRAPWDVESLQEIPRELLERVATGKAKRAAAPSANAASDGGSTSAATPARARANRTAAASASASVNAEEASVSELLNLLSKTRWDDRTTWRNIATALKNDAGDDRHKALWKRMSRVSTKYDDGEAEKLWSTVADPTHAGPKVGHGTLHHLAKQDDPIGYAQYRARHVPSIVMENWDKGDRGLSDIAHHMLKGVLKLTGKKDVFYFDAVQCRWCSGEDKSVWRTVSCALEEALRDASMCYAAQARSEADERERTALDKKVVAVGECVRYVRGRTGMRNVVELVLQQCKDEGFEQRLDSVPYLLGVANGAVDLRTGELRERRPEDMIYRVLEVEYRADADTSVIKRTILEAMADDEEMAVYLQRLWGYGITGETSEEIFPVFTGAGRNCKGVLAQTVQKCLGAFYVEMNVGLICERQVSNIDAERAKLIGARIALFNELKPGERLKTNEVQLLSGGDGIAAKALYKDPITIQPRHLCILSTNHMPELSEVIPAIVERLLCIHFPVTFTDVEPGDAPSKFRRQADRTLKQRLDENKAGTLRWLVEGAMAWYANKGLRRQAPAKVVEFSKKYFEEQDRVAGFLREECTVDATAVVESVELFNAYNHWATQQGAEKLSDKAFAAQMRQKGYEKRQSRVVGRSDKARPQCYIGLRLHTVAAEFDDIDEM